MFIQVDESWENDGLNNREGNLLIDQIVESDVSSIILYMQYCSACLVLDFESEARGYDLSLCDHMILSCNENISYSDGFVLPKDDVLSDNKEIEFVEINGTLISPLLHLLEDGGIYM